MKHFRSKFDYWIDKYNCYLMDLLQIITCSILMITGLKQIRFLLNSHLTFKSIDFISYTVGDTFILIWGFFVFIYVVSMIFVALINFIDNKIFLTMKWIYGFYLMNIYILFVGLLRIIELNDLLAFFIMLVLMFNAISRKKVKGAFYD